MFGDLGQGLVLVAAGYLLGFYLKLDEAIQKLGRILFYCGIMASLAGVFLYGELFGQEFFLVDPIWAHPMTKAADLIAFSYYIAIVHISLGCFLNIYNELSHGKTLHAIFSPWGFVGIWFFWGGTIVLTLNGIDGTFAVLGGLSKPDLMVSSLITLGPTLMLPMALIIFGAVKVEGLSLPWGIYEGYEAFTRFLFNSISYIRVGALAVVHAVFAHIMNMGLAATEILVLDAVILIVGNLFIIGFETLISFIQCLRLHYYEFFSKFYQGEGEYFEPFGVERKYTSLSHTSEIKQ
jgi:V/A-type H+-transporting ATPase subunit I